MGRREFVVVLLILIAAAARAQDPNPPSPSPNNAQSAQVADSASTKTTPDQGREGTPAWVKIGGLVMIVLAFLAGRWDMARTRKHSRDEAEGEQEGKAAFEQRKHDQERQTDRERFEGVLRQELGSVRMLGSPDIPNIPVALLDTFVSLDISPSWRTDRRFGPDCEAAMPDMERSLSPDTVMQRSLKDRVLLIVGDPGSGKTTLLKYYAMSSLSADWARLGFEVPPMPMYLPLRKIAMREEEPEKPRDLHEQLALWAENYPLHVSAETFRRWLDDEPILLLLDGLDEISDLAKRRAVCAWIDGLAAGLPNASIVVTSRWTGYRKTEGIELGCEHLRADIQDFTPEQQAEFLRKWFRAAYLRETRPEGRDEREWIAEQTGAAETHAKAVIEFLADEKNAAIRQLAAVPMLLHIIAVIWKERNILLEVRSDLYQAAIKYLLDFRDRKRNLDPLLPAGDALRVLTPVSLWMQQDQDTDEVSRDAMHERMQPILDTLPQRVEARAFCENVRDRAGLIADYGSKHYIFRHKSFREYLAGVQLAQDVARDPELLKEIVPHVGDDWWEETLRFFMAEADDQTFDAFMDALFHDEISKDLDPKQQALLRTLIGDARQRKTDSLVKCLNDRRFGESKKRYALDCLNAIGTEQALAAVRDYLAQAAPGASAERAEEIVAVHEPLKLTATVRAPITEKPFAKGAKSFRNPFELNAEYILIPGGSFTYSVEKRRREVGDLYFAKYPVTNRRYRRFIRYLQGQEKQLEDALPRKVFGERLLTLARGFEVEGFAGYLESDAETWGEKLRSAFDDDKRFRGEDQPVVSVSWYAARAYCLWLSELESAARDANADGKSEYRLPTEIEWEWAASGGTREYPWGDDPPDDKRANYGGNVGATTPVGQYPDGATPEGLMDMAGNVWEWMDDFERKSSRSLRGGSWLCVDNYLRCSARFFDYPGYRDNVIGFRVVCSQS
ncbi:MAG: SUMF1/EgtB/PvdO family nonheme iron enzyme [Sedimentisphaerales bacterium]|nr:SUMF1/EgtB/PvdO family nonheme iron enzyme [Sedimentisphaerales bacterium]